MTGMLNVLANDETFFAGEFHQIALTTPAHRSNIAGDRLLADVGFHCIQFGQRAVSQPNRLYGNPSSRICVNEEIRVLIFRENSALHGSTGNCCSRNNPDSPLYNCSRALTNYQSRIPLETYYSPMGGFPLNGGSNSEGLLTTDNFRRLYSWLHFQEPTSLRVEDSRYPCRQQSFSIL